MARADEPSRVHNSREIGNAKTGLLKFSASFIGSSADARRRRIVSETLNVLNPTISRGGHAVAAEGGSWGGDNLSANACRGQATYHARPPGDVSRPRRESIRVSFVTP